MKINSKSIHLKPALAGQPNQKPSPTNPNEPQDAPNPQHQMINAPTRHRESNLYNIYNKGNGVIDNQILDIDMKGKMTLQELQFIELYVTCRFLKLKAMEKAGYVGIHNTYKYLLALRILQKYESRGTTEIFSGPWVRARWR